MPLWLYKRGVQKTFPARRLSLLTPLPVCLPYRPMRRTVTGQARQAKGKGFIHAQILEKPLRLSRAFRTSSILSIKSSAITSTSVETSPRNPAKSFCLCNPQKGVFFLRHGTLFAHALLENVLFHRRLMQPALAAFSNQLPLGPPREERAFAYATCKKGFPSYGTVRFLCLRFWKICCSIAA